MPFSADIRVAGYPYDDLAWSVSAPSLVEKGPNGYNLHEHLRRGGVAEAHFENATKAAHPGIWYLVKLDQSAKAKKAGVDQQLAEASRSGETLSKADIDEVWGQARVARLRNNIKEDELRIPLEGLDNAHLMDRLTGEVLNWHGRFFGPAPASG